MSGLNALVMLGAYGLTRWEPKNLTMNLSDFGNHLINFASLAAWQALGLTLSPASEFSVFSLLCALSLAAGFLIVRRTNSRPVRIRVLWRALLPRRWFHHASSHADFSVMAFNLFVIGTIVGGAIVSSVTVEHLLLVGSNAIFGAAPLIPVPSFVGSLAMTIAIYIAYEFAYFANHYLSHHVPILWQFHRTHHTAETLSPVTNYRVHPVDSIVFYNMVGLCIGSAAAMVRQIFGAEVGQFGVGGSNLILLAALYLLTHLHHSHMWIAFTGTLGRIVMSPAHHQLHHSADPEHFNRNFGHTLGLFDWAVGTLHVPTKRRQVLTFGAGPLPYDPHTITGTLMMPFVDAAKLIRGSAATDIVGHGSDLSPTVTSHRLSLDSVPAATSSAA